MVDFLKNNPYVTREEYMWEWSIPQIRLASFDYTHIVYLSDEESKRKKMAANSIRYDNPADFIKHFNIPTIN